MADAHAGSRRFIGLTTDDKKAMLRSAWDAAADNADSLLPQLKTMAAAAREVYDQDLSSSASNSHSATSNQPGLNKATAGEELRAWNQIIEGLLVVRQYLRDCATYGVDAFVTFCNGCFPSPLPATVQNPVTVDVSARWLRLAAFHDVDSSKIVGQPVSDEAVYCWLLDHPNLMNIESGVRESRGDFSMSIIGRGGMQYT